MNSSEYSASRYFNTRFVYNPQREAVWREICDYLSTYIPKSSKVLDIGAGYCSFINNVECAEKYALDVFEGFGEFAQDDVQTYVGSCTDLNMFEDNSLDVVFSSNLLEHLTREFIEETLQEVQRVLKPSGFYIIIQPNFRYCYRSYFDDYTHLQIFTDVGLTNWLESVGFTIEESIPALLPFSFKNSAPKWAWLVRLYLRLPYRPLAKQMLIVAQPKPS